MQYIISGQQPLSGTVSVSGAKNAALKLIIAALMTSGVSVINNVPRIRDIQSLLEIINFLGGKAEFTAKNQVKVENKLNRYDLPLEIAGKTRVSILLIAPLLYQFGKAILPNPGGCRLGERAVDRLVESVIKMGAKILYRPQDGFYHCTLEKPKAGRITFVKKSHTGTELAVMFASKIKGTTLIDNAAKEPEIDDLILFLNRSGAEIKREAKKIVVKGNPALKGTTLTVQPDRIEAATFMVLSALFKGQIKIKNAPLRNLKPFLTPFLNSGFNYTYDDKLSLLSITVPQKILATDIMTAPHPGFLTDWQPLWTVLMTQADGESIVHETVFENRLSYVADLRRFGAKIKFHQVEVKDPDSLYQFNNYDKNKHCRQAISITGPTSLHNALAKMTDIRAGACLVLAALIAQGQSVISGVEQIERGYEDLVGKLQGLGAKIQVLP